MGERLLRLHGLADWELVFDRARTRFGVCRPARRQIGLSRSLTVLSTPEAVRNTVLHEIAHALVGAEHGHDDVWRARALAIGSDGTRTDDLPDGAQGPWQGRCPAGHTVNRHRRPSRVASCCACSPRAFDPTAIYVWAHRGQPAPMLRGYQVELVQIQRRYGLPRTVDTRRLEDVEVLAPRTDLLPAVFNTRRHRVSWPTARGRW